MNIAIISDGKETHQLAEIIDENLDFFKSDIINIKATKEIGDYVEGLGVQVHKFNSINSGGISQVISRIITEDIDFVFLFVDFETQKYRMLEELISMCNFHNIILSTNSETARFIIPILKSTIMDFKINHTSKTLQKRKENTFYNFVLGKTYN